MSGRVQLVWAVLLLSGLASWAGARSAWCGAEESTPPLVDQPFRWQSTNQNSAELGPAVADLYLALYNNFRLPIRAVRETDPDPRSVAILLRDAGAFFGDGGFPEKLDALMCDLNPRVCDRRRIPVPDKLIGTEHTTEHVGGSMPSKGIWRNGKDSVLLIPNINFQTYISISSYKKSIGQTVSSIVIDITKGCSEYDEDCLRNLNALNRPGDLVDDVATKIAVPTLSVETTIDFVDARAIDDQAASQLVPVDTTRDQVPRAAASETSVLTEPSDAVLAPSMVARKASARRTARAAQIVAPIRDRVVGSFAPTLESLSQAEVERGQEDLSESSAQLLNLIRFPYKALDGSDFPDWATASESPVVVLDAPLSGRHPFFKSGWLISGERSRTGTEASACYPLANGLDADHGAHVAALIAGADPDGHFRGVNPYLKMHVHDVDFGRLSDPTGSYSATLTTEVQDIQRQERPNVYNLSLAYTSIEGSPGAKDPLLQWLRAQNFSLVVVAAGNVEEPGGRELTGGCSLQPTCSAGSSSIISVVGLSRDAKNPTIYKSLYRFDDLQIGAIAQDVVSAGSAGTCKVMSGSSQAAAQVSAVAATMFAKDGRLRPSQVKNRILSCATFVSGLRDKLWSGILDADCALSFDHDYIATVDGKVLKGTVRRVDGNSREDENVVVLKKGGQEQFFDLNRDWALWRDEPNAGFIRLRMSEADDRMVNKLERSSGFKASGGQVVVLETDSSSSSSEAEEQTETVPLKDIVKLVPKLKTE